VFRLSQLTKVLSDAFGQRTTLGKLSVLVEVHERLASGEQFSMSQIAEATDQPLSSVSRWVNEVGYLILVDDPVDERRKLVQMSDSSNDARFFVAIDGLLADDRDVDSRTH
jgi:DNA-binding MarR family transcriptional regulator